MSWFFFTCSSIKLHVWLWLSDVQRTSWCAKIHALSSIICTSIKFSMNGKCDDHKYTHTHTYRYLNEEKKENREENQNEQECFSPCRDSKKNAHHRCKETIYTNKIVEMNGSESCFDNGKMQRKTSNPYLNKKSSGKRTKSSSS